MNTSFDHTKDMIKSVHGEGSVDVWNHSCFVLVGSWEEDAEGYHMGANENVIHSLPHPGAGEQPKSIDSDGGKEAPHVGWSGK